MSHFKSLIYDLESIIMTESSIQNIQGELTLEEKQFAADFGHVRQDEFRAGRLLARHALEQFGIESFSILADHNRCPIWPVGIVGSIAHTIDYCLCIVGSDKLYAGIGVDLEIIDRVKSQLWPRICTESELKWIENKDPSLHNDLAALIFSAKEAFYKCQFPLTNQVLGFNDVEISADLDNQSFYVKPVDSEKIKMKLKDIAGRFIFRGKYVGTFYYLKHSD